MKDYRASRKWIRWILPAITVIVLFLHAGLLLSSTLKNSCAVAFFPAAAEFFRLARNRACL
jgi:hypothetical protein